MTKRSAIELIEAKQLLQRAKALSGITAKDIATIQQTLPQLPRAKRQEYFTLGLE